MPRRSKTKPRPKRSTALASANSSEAVEATKFRLVGAACMYGAGYALLNKCPDLGGYECFRRTIDEAAASLKLAARAYYTAVCEPPNNGGER